MRLHDTKNKGDLGILHAQLDLAKKGFGILTPLTEHEAFDLVAYKDQRFYRVQVKYRAARVERSRLTSRRYGPTGTAFTGSSSTRAPSICTACSVPTPTPATTSTQQRIGPPSSCASSPRAMGKRRRY